MLCTSILMMNMSNLNLKNILPSRLYEVAEKAGINTTRQIIILSFWDIKKLTKLNNDDIQMLKNIVTYNCCPVSFTLNTLGKQERKLITGCAAIDKILNGGFRRGTLTEIYGESGSGKTQVVMQVAGHCGQDGCAFICTEDSFPVKRFKHIQQFICKEKNKDIGKNIFIEHVAEANDLLTCIRVRLPKLLNVNKILTLIVDSVAAPFRCEYTNYVQRAEELKELGVLLYKLAQEFNIAVICINQVTSSFDISDNVLPSLGLVWSNMISNKIKINKTNDVCYNQDYTIRELKVMNAPDLPMAVAKFIITPNGVEDIAEEISGI